MKLKDFTKDKIKYYLSEIKELIIDEKLITKVKGEKNFGKIKVRVGKNKAEKDKKEIFQYIELVGKEG